MTGSDEMESCKTGFLFQDSWQLSDNISVRYAIRCGNISVGYAIRCGNISVRYAIRCGNITVRYMILT